MAMILTILLSILSLEADFVQTKTIALMTEPQTATGHMIYRAPDYLQWAYDTPQQIVWEIDGDKSNVNPQIQRLLRMIMASIANGNTQDEKIQREANRLFRSIDVIMDEQNGVAKRVEMIEKKGDTTIIEFTNVVKK